MQTHECEDKTMLKNKLSTHGIYFNFAMKYNFFVNLFIVVTAYCASRLADEVERYTGYLSVDVCNMATCLLHVFLDIDINAIHSALLKTSNGFLSSIQDDAFSGQYLGKHFLRLKSTGHHKISLPMMHSPPYPHSLLGAAPQSRYPCVLVLCRDGMPSSEDNTGVVGMVTVLDVPGDGIGEVRAVIMAQYVKMNGRAVYNLKPLYLDSQAHVDDQNREDISVFEIRPDVLSQDYAVQDSAVKDFAVMESAVQDYVVHDSSVQCSFVQDSSVQCSSVQDSSVQCSSVQDSSVQCSSVQDSSVQCSSVQDSSVQCSSVQDSSVQCSSVQDSSVQCSSVQDSNFQAAIQDWPVLSQSHQDCPETGNNHFLLNQPSPAEDSITVRSGEAASSSSKVILTTGRSSLFKQPTRDNVAVVHSCRTVVNDTTGREAATVLLAATGRSSQSSPVNLHNDSSAPSPYANSSCCGNRSATFPECAVCLSRTANCVLLPCRHTCVCRSCFGRLSSCPLCRRHVEAFFVMEGGDSVDHSADLPTCADFTGWFQRLNTRLNRAFGLV